MHCVAPNVCNVVCVKVTSLTCVQVTSLTCVLSGHLWGVVHLRMTQIILSTMCKADGVSLMFVRVRARVIDVCCISCACGLHCTTSAVRNNSCQQFSVDNIWLFTFYQCMSCVWLHAKWECDWSCAVQLVLTHVNVCRHTHTVGV